MLDFPFKCSFVTIPIQEMQGQMSSAPYQQQGYPSPSTQPDVINSSTIQDGVYFAMPSPRHSMSDAREEWSEDDTVRRMHDRNCKS